MDSSQYFRQAGSLKDQAHQLDPSESNYGIAGWMFTGLRPISKTFNFFKENMIIFSGLGVGWS